MVLIYILRNSGEELSSSHFFLPPLPSKKVAYYLLHPLNEYSLRLFCIYVEMLNDTTSPQKGAIFLFQINSISKMMPEIEVDPS